MRHFRRRRMYSILAFLGIAAAVFICFQLFSLRILNNQRTNNISQRQEINGSPNIVIHDDQALPNYHGADESECLQGNNCVIKDDLKHLAREDDIKNHKLNMNQAIDGAVKKAVIHSDKETAHLKQTVDRGSLPRGVAIQYSVHYIPDSKNNFKCVMSKERISFDRVNDEYCDCLDGSDEPGTSACPDNKFYCKFQLDEEVLTWVWSSRVNDGLCDCCDGSDEWQNPALPAHVQLNDEAKHFGVYQSPCSDHCEELRQRKKAKEELLVKGKILRLSYVQTARQEHITDELYGSDGAFYQLSKQCYDLQVPHYNYHLCPFKSSSQKTIPGSTKSIGRVPHWDKKSGKDGFRLVMKDGDREQCPGGLSRKTTVVFNCALEDKIASVEEDEKCSYLFNFDTPAACV